MKLADTYERIAEGGADVFYLGEMAQNLTREIQAAGANLQPITSLLS